MSRRVDRERLRELYECGLIDKEIAKEMGHHHCTIRSNRDSMGLEPNKFKLKRLERDKQREELLSYLELNGPTDISVLETKLKIGYNTIVLIYRGAGLRRISQLCFRLSGHKRIASGKPVVRFKVFLMIPNDKRIAQYIRDRVPYDIETKTEACFASLRFNRMFGCEIAALIISKMGYTYQVPRTCSIDRRGV